MGLNISKQLSTACAGLLMAASFVSSDFVLDNFDDGDGTSNLQSYWYFYTDAGNGGTSTVGGVSVEPPFNGFYEGKDGTNGVKMEFVLGASTSKPDVQPYVAFETEFVKGEAIDLTGVEKIRFDIKGSSSVKKIQLSVPTLDVKDYNYHQKIIDVTETWTTQEILFKNDLTSGLRQEPWGTAVTFSPANVQKFLIKARKNENTTLTSGTLWIDNIVLVGNAKNLKRYGQIDTVSPGNSTGALLSNFNDNASATSNSLGFYWYSYTDQSIQGTSEITRGVTNGFLTADETNGINGSGGLSISFVLGNKLKDQSGNTIIPFVGVGTELGTTTSPYNATSAGAIGIYLEYKSDALFIDVEVEDNKSRPDGVVWFSKLPPTNNGWRGAVVDFNNLSLTSWAPQNDPLDKSKLVKVNFKISDEDIKEGSVSIDNVYLIGATGIMSPYRAFISRGITMDQKNNVLNITFNSNEYLSGSRLSLFNTLGKVVAYRTIGAGQTSCSIPLLNNATGMYLLSITSNNGSVQTAPVLVSH